MSLVICTWPSCGHTAKGQCRPLQEGGNLAAADRLTALEAEVARLQRRVNFWKTAWINLDQDRHALAQGEQP